MAYIPQRKFGTDLSNVDNRVLAKRLSTKNVVSKSIGTPVSTTLNTIAAPQLEVVDSRVIDEELEKMVSVIDEVTTPKIDAKSFKYEPTFATDESKQIFTRDFLMQFKDVSNCFLFTLVHF